MCKINDTLGLFPLQQRSLTGDLIERVDRQYFLPGAETFNTRGHAFKVRRDHFKGDVKGKLLFI